MQPQSQPLLWKGVSAAAACDPYFNNTVLLMGFEGANGSQTAPGMNDESPAMHGTATVQATAAISTAQFKFGASSLNLPASTKIQFANSADWQFGSGNFTIEGWVYPVNDTGTGTVISLWQAGQLSWLIYTAVVGDHKFHWDTSTNGSAVNADIIGATTIVTSTWYHLAIDFDGSKYRLYLNGVMDGSFSTPRTLFASTAILTMGTSNGASANPFTGNLDEMRITKGIARYASDAGFTVPTAAFPRISCITPTTFDPATLQSATLSGGNLVATNTGTTGTNQGAMALASSAKSSGKYYWETTYNIWGDSSVLCLYGCALIPVGTTDYHTAGTTGIGGAKIAITGSISANGTGGGTLGALSQGDVIAIAVDITNLKIWFRGVGGPDFPTPGQWNGAAINGNPATGTGGTTIIGGSLVPAVCFGGTGGVSGNKQTANFGGSRFLGQPPAGFTAGWPA